MEFGGILELAKDKVGWLLRNPLAYGSNGLSCALEWGRERALWKVLRKMGKIK